MNKKIMSFVLAMFLSVGLGVSNLLAGDNYNAHGGNGGSDAVMQSSGTARSTNPSASSLTDRISQVFHYEDGILVSATGADGTVTVYDQGKYRGTMTMGLDGNYTWSSFALYGSDNDKIAAAGGLEAFLLSVGFKPEQLTGGGEEATTITITSDGYSKLSDEEKKYCKPDTDTTYYIYKTKVDDQEVEKLITEEEYNALDEDKKANCKKYEGTVYKYEKPATAPQQLGWFQRAQDHLAKGQNYSIQINFAATQGASLTLCIDGKAMETYAWDDALISYVEYNRNGYNTFTLEKGVSLQESLETGKTQTEDKWVCTVTLNGKIQGQYDVIPNADGSSGFTLSAESSVQYEYNADGTIASVFNAETSQTTYYNANKVMSVTGPLKDSDGNTITNEDGSPQIVTLALYKYTDNGMYDSVTSFGTDGSLTTTVYFNNKAMGTYRGGPELAELMRKQILNIWETATSPTEFTGTYDIDSRLISVTWYAEQYKAIQENGEIGIKNFMKVRGLDYDNEDARKAIIGGYDKDGVWQAGEIEKGLKYTNWISPVSSLTYFNTAYSQGELDAAEDKAEGEKKASKIPANKYTGSVTLFNKGAQLATYDFSNLDPSISRAYYIFFNDTFDTEGQAFQDMCAALGINFSDTMSQREFEEAIEKIIEYIEKLMGDVSITETTSGNTTTWTVDLSAIQALFREGKIGEFTASWTHVEVSVDGGTNVTDGGTNATHSHNRRSTSVSRTTSTSNSTTTSGPSKESVREALENALFGTKNADGTRSGGLLDTIKNFFYNASAKIKSGNFDNLMDCLGQKISEGYNKSETQTTTTTTTTTVTTHTDIDLDPAVVGTVESVVIMDSEGNIISEEDYNKLSEEDKARYKKYALLTGVSVDIGYGFGESDKTGKERMYVEITDDEYNNMKEKLANGDNIAYAAAGYIGTTLEDGTCVLVNTYASDIGTDIDTLKSSFEARLADTSTAEGQKFQEAMAENRALFEQWGATSDVMQDWSNGWDLLLDHARQNPEEELKDVKLLF